MLASTSNLSYWFPLITAGVALLTALLTVVSSQTLEWLKERRSYRREVETRLLTRREALRERRNDFQRQTLLDLQDAILEYVSVKLETQRLQPSNELASKVLLANARITKLMTRVEDEEVRRLIDRAQEATRVTRPGESPAAAERPLGLILEEINNRIGGLLRKLDSEESL
ncbi:hypothetical protein [Granulicella tundricola]|uniref:Uncharacterized protein n=1 Tax=Granulicella tundricola (strain ATCC BAA-1859 / DSM 23138 / MP5ACTX9) TaxID=1198114 RepID=E8WX97_GRATM|nr:hypothetical protein [Granulicella tundricola]ADW69739.1 hypothetical protein AciX9_2715 [Granulicella tundricola MP5ACTX9]